MKSRLLNKIKSYPINFIIKELRDGSKWLFYCKSGKDDICVCSEIHVLYRDWDLRSHGYSLLLSFLDDDDNLHEFWMPINLFMENQKNMRENLLSKGLKVVPNAHRLLRDFFVAHNSDRLI